VSSLFQVEGLGPQQAVAVLSHLPYPEPVFPALDSRLSFLTYPSQAVEPPEEGAASASLLEFISQGKVISTPSKPCSEGSFIVVIWEYRFINPSGSESSAGCSSRRMGKEREHKGSSRRLSWAQGR